MLDENDAEWNVEEEALVKADGTETLARLPGHVSYWFGWFAFHPDTRLFGEISSGS